MRGSGSLFNPAGIGLSFIRSIPVVSLSLNHRLITGVLPGRQYSGISLLFQANKSFTALPVRHSRQRANDTPILNPSCDAHEPAVPVWILVD